MEINLQLEYQTLVEELQLKLATANQKFQLLTEASDDTWHEIKADFELIWDSLHELIKSRSGNLVDLCVFSIGMPR